MRGQAMAGELGCGSLENKMECLRAFSVGKDKNQLNKYSDC